MFGWDKMPTSLQAAFVLAAYVVIILMLGGRILQSRKPVGATLAWLLLVFVVPVLGAFLYLLIGESHLGKYRARRAKEAFSRYVDSLGHYLPGYIPDDPAKLLWDQTHRRMNLPVLTGNQAVILFLPDEILDHILADISAAKATVYIEFYIYYNGGRIREIHDELINARERGLEVKMLLDSVGSRTFLRSKEATSLRDAGVEIVEALYANPLRFFLRRLDLRLHRKIILIDGCIGYSGSMNMADPRVFGLNESVGHWIDLMVRVEGPAVAALSGIFSNDWQIETGVSLTNMVYPLACTDPDCMPIQVVPSGPAIAPDNLLHLLLTSIYTARFSIELTTPYFVPDDALVLALKAAALRGVRVSIYLPMRNNSRLVNYASRAFFSELMKAGVRICPFKNGLLHTKCLLVDRQIALVGSVNLDMRSLWLNFEVTLVLSDDGFCQELGRLIDRYNSESDTLDYDRWQRRSRFKQFVENMTRLISPLL